MTFVPMRGPMNEQEYRHYVEQKFEMLDRQVKLIVQILDEHEQRGWMSADPKAVQSDKKIKQLLEQLRGSISK